MRQKLRSTYQERASIREGASPSSHQWRSQDILRRWFVAFVLFFRDETDNLVVPCWCGPNLAHPSSFSIWKYRNSTFQDNMFYQVISKSCIVFFVFSNQVLLPDASFPLEFFHYSSNVGFILFWSGWRKGEWDRDEFVNFRPFLVFDCCYIIISTSLSWWIEHYISLKNIFSVVIDFTTSCYTIILRVVGICKVFICKLSSYVIVRIFNLNQSWRVS